MESVKESEVETNKTAVARDGRIVKERTRETATEASSKTVIVNIIWLVYGVIAVLLAGRFIFKLTGANNTGFVNFIYSITNFLSKPFDSIFGATTAAAGHIKSVIQPSIIVAIVVYGLIAWGLVKLLGINEPRGGTSI